MKALLKISGVWKQEANGEITINTEESMLFTTAKKKKKNAPLSPEELWSKWKCIFLIEGSQAGKITHKLIPNK